MVLQYGHIFKSAHYVPLYNVVFDEYSEGLMNEDVNEEWFLDKSTPILIAAGALEVWKGFSDLLLAMRELVKIRKIRLIILGDGPQRQILQVFINNFNLDHAVKLLGYVDNPLKYFKRADIFVLSSYVEGLPNVLVEAMMCGCTPVATDCPTGPREVLQDGKYGYLVPVGNPIALMNGIEMAINYPISKEQLNEAINPFTETEVIKKHLNLLGISS
jgi:glycosyltransferase involved in cell wall biosynthesis